MFTYKEIEASSAVRQIDPQAIIIKIIFVDLEYEERLRDDLSIRDALENLVL